jgi:hypothetical protein
VLVYLNLDIRRDRSSNVLCESHYQNQVRADDARSFSTRSINTALPYSPSIRRRNVTGLISPHYSCQFQLHMTMSLAHQSSTCETGRARSSRLVSRHAHTRTPLFPLFSLDTPNSRAQQFHSKCYSALRRLGPFGFGGRSSSSSVPWARSLARSIVAASSSPRYCYSARPDKAASLADRPPAARRASPCRGHQCRSRPVFNASTHAL